MLETEHQYVLGLCLHNKDLHDLHSSPHNMDYSSDQSKEM